MHLNEISYLQYIYNAVHSVSNVSLKIVENMLPIMGCKVFA